MSGLKLLRQFVDSFQRFDDMLVVDAAPLDMIIEQDTDEWDSWSNELSTWKPIPFETSPEALQSIYTRIAGRFPTMYEQLILSYRWFEVDLKIIRLFANPSGPGLTGLTEAIFNDRILSNVLLPAGFVPFAKAADDNYDSICFDLNKLTQGDCPIIQFEHEAILSHSKIGKQWKRWDSFRDLMTEVVFLEAE
ncbi:MAG: hypothetical protein JKY95_05255 [Planctomycetaceae bacterium]|nr:hypothetical protein [Planctomycetaceae bacterium]